MTEEKLLPGLSAVRAFGRTRAGFWGDPPRGVCSVEDCPEENPIVYKRADESWVCAGHYRILEADRGRVYPCDRCGKATGSTVRDPLHRRDEYLCADCHREDGFDPTERAAITVIQERVGRVHSQGRQEVCDLRGATDCAGQVKPRGKKGIMCDKHHDPKKWMAGVQ